MSQMNHAAFAQSGIQELNFDEVDLVGGAVDADDVITVAAFVGAAATIVAVASGGPTNPVGAAATAVVGLSAIAGGIAALVDDD